ncbi:prepilin-type N-terminal cleavage/methylation domain-containing protein [Rheinheimera marina]|uniref:Prepilin-type N-terminal cleavage/methylation domain-containing protein n=1 Tax=Rheinheimera marina TaxID=1774958 RepID=A0ABV9JIZ1_9GAMM
MLKPVAAKGFTLLEIIIGIVVLGIALVVITGALGPLFKQSTDPWHQVRAAELGHSLLNEIMARSFDENSDRAAGEYRCGDSGYLACSNFCNDTSVNQAEAEDREFFDDVDDFNGLTLSGNDIINSSTSLAELYSGYSATVVVSCAGTELGFANEQLKKIKVTITTPTGQSIGFSAYRGNW